MVNIIENVTNCESVYGVVGLILTAVVIIVLAVLAFKAPQFVLPYIYKIVCKICNTIKTYNTVHASIGVDDVSIEADLNR